MTTKDFIQAWDGLTPLWLNIHHKNNSVEDCEILYTIQDYDALDGMVDDFEVEYITATNTPENSITIELTERG